MEAKDKVKVLLVDDHQIFRDGIQSLFKDEEEIEIVGVATSGGEAIQKIMQLKPDICLLDISMPDLSGIEVMERINNENIKCSFLVLSMHNSEDYIFKAIRAGAKGYLPKEETTKAELHRAIRFIAKDQEYYSDSVAEIMKAHFLQKAKNQNKNAEKGYEQLSKREVQVLKLVVEGLTNSEIAAKLFVNIRTVETHKTNILQKLQLKNTVELVKFAIKNNLLEL